MKATKERKPKGEAIRVRPDTVENGMLAEIRSKTNLKNPEIARRAMKFALPLFLSGEVDLLTLERKGA